MKVLCGRDHLRDALSILTAALPSRTTKPVLEAILFEAEGDTLKLQGTDLEMAVSYSIPEVRVESPGRCLVPSREVSEFVRDLSDDAVTIELQKSTLRVFGRDDQCEVAVADVGEFPEMPQVEENHAVSLAGSSLARMIERTAFAAAREIGRFAMNGVRLELRPDGLRMVATDGRRLSQVEQPAETGVKESVYATLPTKTVQQLVRVFGSSDEPVRLSLGSERASFHSPRATIVTRLLEGEFPKYQSVVPKSGKNVAHCESKVLTQKLRLVAHLCTPEQPIVRLKFTGGYLTLSASSPQRGEAKAEMPAEFEGTQHQIAFNPDYVLEGLKTCQSENVRLEFNDGASPGKFHLNEHHEYVVMPVVNE